MPSAARPIQLLVTMVATLLALTAFGASPASAAGLPGGFASVCDDAIDDDELLPVEEDKAFRPDGDGGFQRVEGGDADAERDDFEDEAFEEDDAEHEGIPVHRVPKPVLAAFKKQFGNDAEIHSVSRETEGGEVHAYFIEGEAGAGAFIEMAVSADGGVIGYAQEIGFDKAPKAVRSAALKAATGDKPDEIYCVLIKEDETHYHVALEFDEEARTIELTLDEDGTVLEKAHGIDPSSLPAKILKLIETEVGRNAHIEEAVKVESIDELPHYVVIGIVGNQGFEFFASADGSEVEFELHGIEDEDDFEDEGGFEDDEAFEDED